MCICFIQVGAPGSQYPLIFCGNRDEFYSRDSIGFHRWPGSDGIYGGIDGVRGGTWLGMRPSPSLTNHKFRFAVVHDFRQSDPTADATKSSRGDLPVRFLTGQWTAREYAEKVSLEGSNYMGFTLIVADEETGVYFTSNRAPHRKLEPGIYSLCTALLDTAWPKVTHGKELFRNVLVQYAPKTTTTSEEKEEDELMHQMCRMVLRDNTVFPHPLPRILDAHTEILLSSIFIDPCRMRQFGLYGTRMQTCFVIRKDGSIRGQEHAMDTLSTAKDWRGAWKTTHFELSHKDMSTKIIGSL